MRRSQMIGQSMSFCVIAILATGAVPSVRAAAPATPDNAALLYYQAFIGAEDVRSRHHMKIDAINRGDDPTPDIESLVTRPIFRLPLEIADVALEIPRCDWGFLSSGPNRGDRIVDGKAYGLASLFKVDARVLAFKGQYRPALENALKLRRFAGHIGDDTYFMWVTANRVNSSAFLLIRQVLGMMPPNVEMLAWLKREIALGPRASWRPRETLEKWRDMGVRGWQAYRADYAELLPGEGEDKATREQALNIKSTRMAYDVFLESALTILESDVTYETKHARMTQLMDRIAVKGRTDDATAIMMPAMQWWGAYYQQHVLYESTNAAVKVAIDIYLVRAETGQLPPSLPPGLPKDPFSGEDFAYTLTDDGFTLRCHIAPIDHQVAGSRLKLREYDFKVTD